MSVLVTGAAGFVGSHVVDRLLSSGEAVVGLDNFDDFYPRAVKERNLSRAAESEAFVLVEGDIRDPDVLAALPGGIDAVVHLAARAGVRPSLRSPSTYADVNITGTTTLLEWARGRGIRPFVLASSSSVYGAEALVPFSEDAPAPYPISPYAASKRAAELVCYAFHHLYGTPVVCLRLFTVYGPRQRPDLAIHKFVRLLAEGAPIPMYGDGSTERDYTFVDDIVEGLVQGLRFVRQSNSCFEIINLGGNRTTSLKRVIEVISEEMGVTPSIDVLPAQPGDVPRTYADIEKAKRLLGYEPRVDLRSGMRAFLAWYHEGE